MDFWEEGGLGERVMGVFVGIVVLVSVDAMGVRVSWAELMGE